MADEEKVLHGSPGHETVSHANNASPHLFLAFCTVMKQKMSTSHQHSTTHATMLLGLLLVLADLWRRWQLTLLNLRSSRERESKSEPESYPIVKGESSTLSGAQLKRHQKRLKRLRQKARKITERFKGEPVQPTSPAKITPSCVQLWAEAMAVLV